MMIMRSFMARTTNNRIQAKADRELFRRTVRSMARNEKVQSTRKLTQHGNVSVFAHSVAVAHYSVKLARALKLECDKRSLIRGAMLHDFFLYDWHKMHNAGDGLHGFAHPTTASKNAVRHFRLNKRELDIIRKHMWPLTLTKMPKYIESWLVCAADKYCSLMETFHLNNYDDHTFLR